MDKNSKNQTSGNKRIAKNTLLLYFRTILIMSISLYTSRVILNVLGVNDFGLYNVVGGIVAMFSILSGSLLTASQRFLSYEIGRGDLPQIQKTFFTSITVHFILGVAVIVVAEGIGFWFVNYKMNIPSERLPAANWVFQCSLGAFFINIISVPYRALIVSHERMDAFAYISIVEAILKLAVVYLLLCISFDKLVVYAVLIFLVALIVRIIYSIYCLRHFAECKGYRFQIYPDILKSMLGFSGWNFIGSSAAVLRDQGINVLLNLFFGLSVNAARGIAMQVQNAVYSFISNFQTAVNPQITGNYASANLGRVKTLVLQGGKFSFYLLMLMALPILIETNDILTLWLKVVPDQTVAFVRLTLIYLLLDCLSRFMIVTVQATGNIKKYQLIVGGLKMSVIFITYLFFLLGSSPITGFLVNIGIEIVCLGIRLQFMRTIIDLDVGKYVTHILLRCFSVLLLSAAVPLALFLEMQEFPMLSRILVITGSSLVTSIFTIYFIGFSKEERLFVLSRFKQLKDKIL